MGSDASRAGLVLASRYRLDDLLQEGAGARFWRATDSILARNVAVHVVDEDDERAEAMLEAARMSATVADPHLLRVLDAAREDGLVYVVHEWGAGMSLDRMVASAPLRADRAAWLVKEVAEAVAEAHAHGIAHGHLVPENVLVTETGTVKLIGFVVDAVLRLPRGGAAGSGAAGSGAAGSAGPTGPAGPAESDHERDVLNLGALLYTALVGRWPGDGTTAVPPAPVEAGHVLRARQVRAGVPRTLDDLCQRALRVPGHHDDITTARELAAALGAFLGEGIAEPALGVVRSDDEWDPSATQAMPAPVRRSLGTPTPAGDSDGPSAEEAAERLPAGVVPDEVHQRPGVPPPPTDDPEATQAGAPVYVGDDSGVAGGGPGPSRGRGEGEGVPEPVTAAAGATAAGANAAVTAADPEATQLDALGGPTRVVPVPGGSPTPDENGAADGADGADGADPAGSDDSGEFGGRPLFAPEVGDHAGRWSHPAAASGHLGESGDAAAGDPALPLPPPPSVSTTGGGGAAAWWAGEPAGAPDPTGEQAAVAPPGRDWLRLAWIVATVVVLLLAIVLAFNLGRESGPTTSPGGPSASPGAGASSSGGSEQPSKPVAVASVSDFDPEGDPPEENPDLAPAAVDGNPSTTWYTSTYYDDPRLGGLKSGVGVLLDLGQPQQVSSVRLQMVGAPTSVRILAAGDGAALPTDTSGLDTVASGSVGERATLRLRKPVTTQYLVVWLTSLPAVSGGYRGEIAEVTPYS